MSKSNRGRQFRMILALAALLVAISLPGLASAHEKRTVAGRYTFVVGFLDEPAYAGVKNSIDLTICDGNACNYVVKDGARVVDNPVNDAQKTLKVEVIFGGQAALPLDLAARYGQPGKYQGFFLPAKAGSYTFHLSGQLNGQAVDERFVSSPKTFSDAEELKSYPSNDTTSSDALQSQVKEAKDSAGSATIFGIVGIIVGVAGLVAAGLALASSRRSRTNTEAIKPTDLVGSSRG